MKMGASEWGQLFLLSLIWGGSFFLAEIALQEVSALVVVWARVGIAALCLLFVLKITGTALPKNGALWATLAVMGLLNNVLPFCLIVGAQTEISGSLASILNATTPLFTILIAQVFTRDEKLSVAKLCAILIGMAGVVIMVGFKALDGLSWAVGAQVMILGAAISYGFAATWGRRFRDVDPMVTATGQVTVSAVIMTPIAVMFGFPEGAVMPSASTWLALLGLAVLCTAFAYILYFKILKTSGATNLMLVTFLVPLSAIMLGSVFLDERLSGQQVWGMVLILGSLIVMDGRWQKLLSKPA